MKYFIESNTQKPEYSVKVMQDCIKYCMKKFSINLFELADISGIKYDVWNELMNTDPGIFVRKNHLDMLDAGLQKVEKHFENYNLARFYKEQITK